MQARVRNNSASDGGWEELSLPDEVRSVNSSLASEDDEVVILAGNNSGNNNNSGGVASPGRAEMLLRRVDSGASAGTLLSRPPASTPPLLTAAPKPDHASSSVAAPTQAWAVRDTAKTFLANPTESDMGLSPVEKTLLHQITRLSEELEMSKHKNEILEKAFLRDDLTSIQDEDNEDGMYLRLGLKTMGFFLLMSLVQRKFLVSGFVSIFGAALVGGLLTYEQEANRRRRLED